MRISERQGGDQAGPVGRDTVVDLRLHGRVRLVEADIRVDHSEIVAFARWLQGAIPSSFREESREVWVIDGHLQMPAIQHLVERLRQRDRIQVAALQLRHRRGNHDAHEILALLPPIRCRGLLHRARCRRWRLPRLFEGCDGVLAGDLLRCAWNLERAHRLNQQPDGLHIQRNGAVGVDPAILGIQRTGDQRAGGEVRRPVAVAQSAASRRPSALAHAEGGSGCGCSKLSTA